MGTMKPQLVLLLAAATMLASLVGAPPASAQSGCASLSAAIDQLRAQIAREPRDAAQDDQEALNRDIGLYDSACTGGGSSASRGGGYRGGGGNNAANALGAASNLLGALSDLASQLDEDQRDADAQAAREEQQREMDAAIDQANEDAEERAAAAQARAAAAKAKAADDASRQAMVNPFGSSSRSVSGASSNPFAAKPEASSNPFAAKPAAASATPSKPSTSGASQALAKGSCAAGTPSYAEYICNPTPATCSAARDFDKLSGAWSVLCADFFAPKTASAGPAAKQPKPLPNRGPGTGAPGNGTPGSLDPGNGGPRGSNTGGPSDNASPDPQVAMTPGKLPPNDDGAECGQLYGHRARGRCFAPWENNTKEECQDGLGGTYYPADEKSPAQCAYDAPANPLTANDGPGDGQPCGDVGGMTHNHGQCWALGITRSDCQDPLHGTIVDSGGYQYCVYDAAAVAAADKQNPAVAQKEQSLRDRLADSLSNADTQPSPDAATPTDASATNRPATLGQELREEKVAEEIQERKACAALGSNWRYDPTATTNFTANAPAKCFPIFTPGSLKGEPGFTDQSK